MRKRYKAAGSYTIKHLLLKQPKALQKHPGYSLMIGYYQLSPRLQRIRISRRCYSLLNKATVNPQNLKYFYRTYRLPHDPFFPLFFLIKRDYQKKQLLKKEARTDFIAAEMRQLPFNVLQFIKFLAVYEQNLNPKRDYPVWTTRLFPSTKKRVLEFSKFSLLEWISFFRHFFGYLEQRYRAHTPVLTDRLLACFILESLPAQSSPYLPDRAIVSSRYRRLSKLYHPDKGGNPEYFVQLKWARDILTLSPVQA